MKYIKQFLIIITISFIGELLNKAIPLPVPASVYGMLLMFFCLHFKIFSVSSVKEVSSFLIDIMPVLFIPTAVGLMVSWDLLQQMLPAIILSVLATIVVMAVSGIVTQYIIRKNKEDIK